jgi:hypothetical protein
LSKLLKLKEWVIVHDAARHLSTLFEEEVSGADVLRLALDGRLTLSVLFANAAFACRGQVITSDQDGFFGDRPGKVFLGFDKALQHDERVESIYGVWDLMMEGAETYEVERAWATSEGRA